jgi:hypothetical protein
MYVWMNGKPKTISRRPFADAREGSWRPLGEPIVPPKSIVAIVFGEDVPIRRFECPAEALLRIKTVTGITMTRAEVLDSVRLQAGNAAGVAAKTASRLASPDATTVAAFENTFRVKHDSSWRAPAAGWSHSRIVRQRFLGAHRLLKSGALLYSCWGRPRVARGPETSPDYLALAQPGQYWIALGRRYWEANRDGDVDTTTHAFLFAALRAYYGPLLSDAPATLVPPVRMLGNIHCYIQFVANMFNAKLPNWVADNCPKGA